MSRDGGDEKEAARRDCECKLDQARCITEWNGEDICGHLKTLGIITDCCYKDKFKSASEPDIKEGIHLLKQTEEQLLHSDFGLTRERAKLLRLITQQLPVQKMKYDPKYKPKEFNDSVHGYITLHPLLVKIIDTPQFQRLRNIKQMGGAYFVYPAASHNRFEHSIGVAHLAGEMVETLMKKQPDLDITYVEALCVKVAGLCHDLGHGPFSHTFDAMFIPKALKDDEDYKKDKKKFKHEHLSELVFDKIYEDKKKEFLKYGLGEHERKAVKELINPPNRGEEKSWKGKKGFLCEVVSNKANGIDVDKWDYYLRDCNALGLTSTFQLWRLMCNAKVLKTGKTEGTEHICFAKKTKDNIMEMFETRNLLHKKACQHRVCKAVELMIVDALLEDEETKERLRNAVIKAVEDENMDEYLQLTDSVLHDLKDSETRNRIYCRELYGFKEEFTEGQKDSKDTDKCIHHSFSLDYGRDNNPLEGVWLYKKKDRRRRNISCQGNHSI